MVTLVVQAVLLPHVLRWARLPVDPTLETERQLAETEAARAGRAATPTLAARLGVHAQTVERVMAEYDEHLRVLTADPDTTDEPLLERAREYTALRLATIGTERATVVRLRDSGRIDDHVLREVQVRLDREEVGLSGRTTLE